MGYRSYIKTIENVEILGERCTLIINPVTSTIKATDFDGAPYMTVTAGTECEREEFPIKDYSENKGVLDDLIRQGIVQQPHKLYKTGFVSIPLVRLTERYTG